MKTKNLQDLYIIILAGALLLLLFTLLAPFTTTLLFALLLVATFQPFYNSIKKRSNKFIAVVMSTLSVILLVVIPVTLMFVVLSGELTNIANRALTYVNTEFIANGAGSQIIADINALIRRVNPDFNLDFNTIQGTVLSIVSSTGNFVSNILLSTVQNFGAIFAQVIVFLFAIVLIFHDYDKLPNFIRRYSPLSNDLDTLLFNKFISTGKSVLKGIFLVSLIHASVFTAIFYIFGIEALGLFFLLLFLSSLIPGGSQIVWIPVSILLGVTAGWPIGIALFIVSFIGMNIIDSIIRPVLTSGGAQLHPLLSLVCILGGLFVYGLPGLLYGPLIAVLFMTVMNVYNTRFKSNLDS